MFYNNDNKNNYNYNNFYYIHFRLWSVLVKLSQLVAAFLIVSETWKMYLKTSQAIKMLICLCIKKNQ